MPRTASEALPFDARLVEDDLESPRCIEEGHLAPETVLNKLIEENLVGWRGRVDPLAQDNESDPLELDSSAGIEPEYRLSKLGG